jgi:hypothetical protein
MAGIEEDRRRAERVPQLTARLEVWASSDMEGGD